MDDVVSFIDSKLGLIKVFNETNLKLIKKENVLLAGEIIEPNQLTNLNGFFEGMVTYLGMFDEYLQFQVGTEEDLFEKRTYTSEFKKITENRIMTIYQVGTARDYIFKKGIWK